MSGWSVRESSRAAATSSWPNRASARASRYCERSFTISNADFTSPTRPSRSKWKGAKPTICTAWGSTRTPLPSVPHRTESPARWSGLLLRRRAGHLARTVGEIEVGADLLVGRLECDHDRDGSALVVEQIFEHQVGSAHRDIADRLERLHLGADLGSDLA